MPATHTFLQANEIAYEVVDKQLLLLDYLEFDNPPEEVADSIEDEQNSDDEYYDESNDGEDPNDMEGLIWSGPLDAVIHQFAHAFDIVKPIMNRNFRKVFAGFCKLDRKPIVIIIAKDVNKCQVQHGVPREVILMTRVRNHPNVAQILGWKRISNNSYAILMEYYLDCSLQTCFYSKYLISEYMHGLLEGLYYLQSRKVCHRDVAIPNVMWDPLRKCAHIIDFDTACISRGTGYVREVGRPEYDAPEKFQVFNDVADGKVDTRHIRPYLDNADVYSAGVIFYMLLTKREVPPKPHALQRWISKAVERRAHRQYSEFDLLAKMLLPDPRKRISIEEALQHGFFRSYPADHNYLEIENHLYTLLNYEASCEDEEDEGEEGDEQDEYESECSKDLKNEQSDPECVADKDKTYKAEWNSFVQEDPKVVDLHEDEEEKAFLDFLNAKPSNTKPLSCASEDGKTLERIDLPRPVDLALFQMCQGFQVGVNSDSKPPKQVYKPRQPLCRSYE